MLLARECRVLRRCLDNGWGAAVSRCRDGRLLLIALLLLCPTLVHADGGGPILLFINGFLFTVGQVWIVGIEWLLMSRRFEMPAGRLLWIVFLVNLLSAAVCAVGIPMMWAGLTFVVGLVGSLAGGDGGGADLILALGTWIAGDNPPHPEVAVWAAGIGFVVTYPPTVVFEWWVLRHWLASDLDTGKGFLRFMVFVNLVSYVGLVLLALLGLKSC